MDYTYQNGFIGAKSTSILTKNDLQNLVRVPKNDFISTLKLKHYGIKSSTFTIEAMIQAERKKIKEDLYAMMDDHELLQYLFLKYDLTNLQMMIKKVLFNREKGEFNELGQMTELMIQKALVHCDYDQLTPFWAQIFSKLDQVSFTKENLSTVLNLITNQVVYEFLMKRKDEALIHHFKVSADVQNVLILMKSIQLGYLNGKLKSLLNPFGYIEIDHLNYQGLLKESVIKTLYATAYYGKIAELIDSFTDRQDYFSLEMELYQFLLDELKPYEVQTNNASVIITYLIKKEIEAIYIKRAYLEVNNNVSWVI